MRRRALLPAALAALLTLVAALAAAEARGASYEIHACAGGNGSGANNLFVPFGGGTGGCLPGAGLWAEAHAPASDLARSGWTFTAPPGTSVTGADISGRTEWIGWGWGWQIDDTAGYADTTCFPALPCGWLPGAAGYQAWGLYRWHPRGLDARTLRLSSYCAAANCPGGMVRSSWQDLYFTLEDRVAPVVTTSGPAAAGGWVGGVAALAFAASDNTGIARARVTVDGRVRADNSYACDYGYAVPCGDRQGSEPIDTAQLADGDHPYVVEAWDATGQNTSAATGRLRVDRTPPVTTVRGAGNGTDWQPGPVTVTLAGRDELSGMGAADDDEPVERGGRLTYALDGAAPHTVRGDEAQVEVRGDGAHTLVFRAYDVAGNPSPERTVGVLIGSPGGGPPDGGGGFRDRSTGTATFSAARSFAGACPARVALAAVRDTYVDQARSGDAFAGAGRLLVRSAAGANARALLRFDLPSSGGCELAAATLTMDATAAGGGRTLAAYRAGSAWDDAVSWATRPGAVGAPALATPAGPGPVTFDVSDQLRGIYANGDNGLLVRDASEGAAARAEEAFAAAEAGAGEAPRLELEFR